MTVMEAMALVEELQEKLAAKDTEIAELKELPDHMAELIAEKDARIASLVAALEYIAHQITPPNLDRSSNKAREALASIEASEAQPSNEATGEK